MAVSKCDDLNQSFEDQRIIEYFDQQMIKDGIDKEFGDGQTGGLVNQFLGKMKDFTSGRGVVTQTDVEKALKRYVNPKDKERVKLVSEIITKLGANPKIHKMMNYVISKETSKFDQENPYGKIEWTYNQDGKRMPVIETIPIPSLRVIRNYLDGAINGGKMFRDNRGLFGTLQYEWGSPRQTMLTDPSGLMFDVNEVTEVYTYNAQTWANKYIQTPTSDAGKKYRDYGIASISSDLINFERLSGLPDGIGWKLFSEIMDGRTILYDNGAIMRATDEVKMQDGTWEWKNLQPFTYQKGGVEHTLEGLSKRVDSFAGYSPFETMTDAVTQARVIIREIGEEVVEAIDRTAKEESRLLKKAKDAGLEDWLRGHIGNLLDDEIQISGMNHARLKQGKHFPRMYYRDIVAVEFSNSIDAQETQIKRKTQALNSPTLDNPVVRNRLLREISAHEASIIHLEQKMNSITDPELSIDTVTGSPTNSKVWYKNFKNLTRIMNPDMMRYDEDVMMDYVTETSRAVIRNAGVIKVGNALLEAKLNGANDNTIQASMDIFNTTFYSPDAASQFMGVDLRPNTVSRHLAKIGVNRSGNQITQDFNKLSAFTTANNLFGLFQGFVNYSAGMLKMDKVGMEMFLDASYQMTNPKTRDFWRDLIQRSGINTFSEIVDT